MDISSKISNPACEGHIYCKAPSPPVANSTGSGYSATGVRGSTDKHNWSCKLFAALNSEQVFLSELYKHYWSP